MTTTPGQRRGLGGGGIEQVQSFKSLVLQVEESAALRYIDHGQACGPYCRRQGTEGKWNPHRGNLPDILPDADPFLGVAHCEDVIQTTV